MIVEAIKRVYAIVAGIEPADASAADACKALCVDQSALELFAVMTAVSSKDNAANSELRNKALTLSALVLLVGGRRTS